MSRTSSDSDADALSAARPMTRAIAVGPARSVPCPLGGPSDSWDIDLTPPEYAVQEIGGDLTSVIGMSNTPETITRHSSVEKSPPLFGFIACRGVPGFAVVSAGRCTSLAAAPAGSAG